MNNKTLGYVLFNIDYVDVLHNIRVIYVLNYTRNVSDFLCIPNTIEHFKLIFKVSTKHRKIRWFSRKYSLKNDKFSRKCVWRNKHSVKWIKWRLWKLWLPNHKLFRLSKWNCMEILSSSEMDVPHASCWRAYNSYFKNVLWLEFFVHQFWKWRASEIFLEFVCVRYVLSFRPINTICLT